MEKSNNIGRDITLIALNAGGKCFTETGVLQTVLTYAWGQLCHRHSHPQLQALLNKLNAQLEEGE